MNIVVYLLIPAAKGSNGIALYHAFALPFLVFPFTSIPLVYHAIVAVVRDGGAYSGYRNSHRSARPQSTPKPADSWQKIKGDKKKKKTTLSSFLSSAPLHPITAINTTGHSPTLWSFSLPHDHTSHFPSHPFLSWQPFPYIRCDGPLCLLPCSAFFFIPGSNFPIPLIFLPPAHLSFSLSSLHLLLSASLCTSIALCTQAQAIKHAHSHTSISLCLPPCCLQPIL